MPEVEVRALLMVAAVVWAGCGGAEANDLFSPVRGGTAGRGSGGMTQGGAGQGGGAGDQASGGAAGAQPAGSGGSGAGAGGAGGLGSGGTAGAGLGGASAGSSGTTGTGGSSTGGTETSSFSCGSLRCVVERQICIRTLVEMPSGGEQRRCEPYPDSCTARDCSCFCDAPEHSPCGSDSTCECEAQDGRLEIVCEND